MNKNFLINITLAWRNVWKNKRRTILTLLTIMVGSSMIILLNAWATGGHEKMIEDAVSTNTGHIQIHEKGFWDSKSQDYAFKPNVKSIVLLNRLKKDGIVSGYTKRIHANGLLSYKDNTAGAQIQGIDPGKEIKVSNIHTKILTGGRYLKSYDRNSVVLGEVLAKNLEVETGDTISMISQGFDGSIAAENLTVVGLFRTGTPEFDHTLMLMPILLASETFTMMGNINSIAINLSNPSYMENVKEKLKNIHDLKKIEVMGWDELMPELVQFIVMDDFSAYIFDFILFIVVAFGILNTIQMSVFERTREFGIMLAIGTKPAQIISMVLWESVFISTIGIILGVSIGSGLSYYFTINPIDYSEYAKEIAVWGISTTVYPARLTSLNITLTSSLTFLLSIIFSIFPAMRASKLKPIEAIRHL